MNEIIRSIIGIIIPPIVTLIMWGSVFAIWYTIHGFLPSYASGILGAIFLIVLAALTLCLGWICVLSFVDIIKIIRL